MKILITYLHLINPSRTWNETVIYHLKYQYENCESTLEVSNLKEENIRTEFEITLSVGKDADYFTKYRFFYKRIRKNLLNSISDFYKVVNIYIRFVANGSQVVLDIKGVLSDREEIHTISSSLQHGKY
ncbi:hypothetical protein RF11_06212 [Thelohanellus kitauei]|uniref:Uncharacterized protein n=1 Tax=Thelohanellus kitauei TaxID=669202 RepID=A0A0C2MPX4_THEKT|nr:hypothetical protein RF11_06212 [Thelohanellus kitauei]